MWGRKNPGHARPTKTCPCCRVVWHNGSLSLSCWCPFCLDEVESTLFDVHCPMPMYVCRYVGLCNSISKLWNAMQCSQDGPFSLVSFFWGGTMIPKCGGGKSANAHTTRQGGTRKQTHSNKPSRQNDVDQFCGVSFSFSPALSSIHGQTDRQRDGETKVVSDQHTPLTQAKIALLQ